MKICGRDAYVARQGSQALHRESGFRRWPVRRHSARFAPGAPAGSAASSPFNAICLSFDKFDRFYKSENRADNLLCNAIRRGGGCRPSQIRNTIGGEPRPATARWVPMEGRAAGHLGANPLEWRGSFGKGWRQSSPLFPNFRSKWFRSGRPAKRRGQKQKRDCAAWPTVPRIRIRQPRR